MTDTAAPPRVQTSRRPPVRRVVGMVVGVAVVLVLGRLAFAVDATDDVLQLPDAGLVRAAQLSDGTPVFLVHTDDDSVHVVEAFTRRTSAPVGGLVGWCPRAEQFVDPHHGPLYDPGGQRYEVSVPARQPHDALVVDDPGPEHDLVRRGFDRLDGRGDAEDPIRIDDVVDTTGQDRVPLPRISGGRSLGPPASCRTPPRPVIPPDPGDAGRRVLPRNRILDHTFQATTISLPRDRWQITDGYVLLRPDATAQWCRVAPEGSPPTCPDPGPVPLDLDITPAHLAGGWAVLGGPLAARVADGAVVEIAVLPRSTWRGSSLQGATTYQATLVDVVPDRNQVLLAPFDEQAPSRCLGSAQPREGIDEGPTATQLIDADTVFDVDGEADPLALAERGPTPLTTSVEVVVDDVTCRALSVTQV